MTSAKSVRLALLVVLFIAPSCVGIFPSANNLKCYGHNSEEYICTWSPGNESVEYVARYRDEDDWNIKWHECKNIDEPNTCKFYGEIVSDREIQVQPRIYIGTNKSIVRTSLDPYYIIPKSPRKLNVSLCKKPEQLNVKWIDPPGFILYNQLIFRLRYRHTTSRNWRISMDIDGHEYLLDGLETFTSYEIQVQARYYAMDDVYGNWSTSSFRTTKEGAPFGFLKVLPFSSYLNREDATKRDIKISWTKPTPKDIRGILLGYKIELIRMTSSVTQFHVPANKTSLLIPGLKLSENYTAYITAFNSVGTTRPSEVIIPKSDLNNSQMRYMYIIIIICVLTVLVISRVCWMRVKKFKTSMEPFPEPHFFKLDIPENEPKLKPLYEPEIFDELKEKPTEVSTLFRHKDSTEINRVV